MADADYEQDRSRQCIARRPDQKMIWDCNKTKGHRGCHVAYGGALNGPSLPQWEWHDGDAVSVKAAQVQTVVNSAGAVIGMTKPMASAGGGGGGIGSVKYQWTTVLAPSTAAMKFSMCLYCCAAWENGKASTCVCKKTPDLALVQPSRRELAESLLKTMVEWDMRSCTVKQQREFLDAIRILKKEAKP